jgi:hypothetical protein
MTGSHGEDGFDDAEPSIKEGLEESEKR